MPGPSMEHNRMQRGWSGAEHMGNVGSDATKANPPPLPPGPTCCLDRSWSLPVLNPQVFQGAGAAPVQERWGRLPQPVGGVPRQPSSPPGQADLTPHGLLQPGFHPSWPPHGKQRLITHLPSFAGYSQVSAFGRCLCHLLPGLWVAGHGDGQGGSRGWQGAAVRPSAGRGYRTGAAQDDNQSSLLSAPWGVRAGWGQGRSPNPCPSPRGRPGQGCPLPAAFPSGFVSAGLRSHPPNMHVGLFPPRGAANPPRNSLGDC